jgi:hypothetical protein
MVHVADRVLDLGFAVLASEADALTICDGEPTTYTEAVTNLRGRQRN